MKNTDLQQKLENLYPIGLTVVNTAVTEAINYIKTLESAPEADVSKLVALEGQLASANTYASKMHATLEAVQASDLPNKEAFLAFFAS